MHLAELAAVGQQSAPTAKSEGREPMAFSLPDHWVWDFWLADDTRRHHLFFLHAPKALGDPELRHRNARIGHASSDDLVDWEFHGPAFDAGPPESFDATATWTGSVVRGDDGLWRMFYTGARFLSATSNANIEAVGVATSHDLFTWTKLPGPVVRADVRWYETLGSSSWTEEAWRDPWVFADSRGQGWHMLITARASVGPDAGRGVIGHAVSSNLRTWHTRPPLSAPHTGFSHLEVPQVVGIEGHWVLLFCCNTPRLANERAGAIGGIWTAPAESPVGRFDIAHAKLLVDERYYAGRLVQTRTGAWVLLAFLLGRPGEDFVGGISDPMPVRWDGRGLALGQPREEP
jgi:beta-fructofuranosidase